MIRYRIVRPRRPIDLPWTCRARAVVWVDSADPDEDGMLRCEGDADLLERFCHELTQAYGSRGRPLDDGPLSPRDLACALDGRWLKQYEAETIDPS